jgi:Zn-dependent protease
MFQSRWQLFRVAGIAIAIDASWLIVFALLSWTFAREFGTLASVPPAHAWAMGVVTCLAFFACILLHELGHALVARREGIPLRGITLFLFGGVAEMEGDVPSARKEFWMAVAGPAVTGVLILIFWGLRHLGAEAGWPVQVLAPLQYLTVINLVVLVFNLIPAFPLDGGRVFRAALWAYTGSLRRATYWASWTGRAFAWLLIALGVLSMIGGDFVGGLWSILIGLFLHNAAAGSYRLVLVRQVLQGTPVARFMNPEPITVPPDLDLRRWVEEYVYRYHYKAYPAVADGHLVGMVGWTGSRVRSGTGMRWRRSCGLRPPRWPSRCRRTPTQR